MFTANSPFIEGYATVATFASATIHMRKLGAASSRISNTPGSGTDHSRVAPDLVSLEAKVLMPTPYNLCLKGSVFWNVRRVPGVTTIVTGVVRPPPTRIKIGGCAFWGPCAIAAMHSSFGMYGNGRRNSARTVGTGSRKE